MKWWRFYSEALNDPKVQLLPGEDFKGWANLLNIVNETEPSRGPRSGWLPAKIEDTAYKLHGRAPDAVEQTVSLLERLVAVGLFDESKGRYRAHNWPKRQPISDDVGARVSKSRKGVSGNGSETLHAPKKRRTSTAPEGEGEGEGELDRDVERDLEEREGSRDRAPEAPRAQEIAEQWVKVQRSYEEHVGTMQPADQQRLSDYLRQLPDEWVLAAIEDTGKAKDPGWPYLDGILARCVRTSKPPSSLAKSRKKQPEPTSARGQILDRYRQQAAAPSR
jgi:hypothetical protein